MGPAVDQQFALVTGANKGIGLAVARGLLEMGITVYLGARNVTRGVDAVAALSELGLPARFILLDVTEPESILAAADTIHREAGVLDILINNAGIVVRPTLAPSQTSVDDVRQTYGTNEFGVVAVTNAMLPLLRSSRAGRIVNLTSDLGSLTRASCDPTFPQLLAYNSSKTALNAVTIAYANELRGQGILVNAVSPGSVATDQNGHMGILTTEQGARLPIRMATLPCDGPTGTAVTVDNDLNQHVLPW
jgi:NAD(P)-dependent dehydrogenase (short-subunit alcohol dehydrogenase family)